LPCLLEFLYRFRRDERGAFMVLFAVLALVLVATSGAVVDFTSTQQTRSRAQTALDSAALALQPRIKTDSVATLKAKAQAILGERLGDESVTAVMATPKVDLNDGSLELSASVTKPTAFVGIIGISSITVNLVSEATRKQLDLEVAMVLDNSGSMSSYSRMSNLQLAARCATDVLFNGTADCSTSSKIGAADALAPSNENVKVTIVPFTEFVNVGTANNTATWMDRAGTSAVARSGFDDDDDAETEFTGDVNRFTLFSNLGLGWQGCVEARNHTTGAGGLYYDTSDLAPTASVPDSLFAPAFAPDQKGGAGDRWSGYADSYIDDAPAACPATPSYTETTVRTKCDTRADRRSEWSDARCRGGTTTTYEQTVGGVTTSAASSPPAQLLHIDQPDDSTDSYSYKRAGSGTYKYTITRVRRWEYAPFPDRVLQERLCKYVAGNDVSSLSNGPGGRTGPNAECPSTTLLPLTQTKSTVISRIKAMSAEGGTNIHMGVVWGFRALSPTEPFSEGKAYDSATSKVMIVMTDGENTHSHSRDFNGADWYVAYGYPYYGRLTGDTTAELQTEMDNRTKSTCSNAKTAGITIYTIGLSAPNKSTKDMLTDCASDGGKAYFPTDSADLTSVFQEIAGQLADLRLAR
jgi:Flp pilus assembly protein TadG